MFPCQALFHARRQASTLLLPREFKENHHGQRKQHRLRLWEDLEASNLPNLGMDSVSIPWGFRRSNSLQKEEHILRRLTCILRQMHPRL